MELLDKYENSIIKYNTEDIICFMCYYTRWKEYNHLTKVLHRFKGTYLDDDYVYDVYVYDKDEGVCKVYYLICDKYYLEKIFTNFFEKTFKTNYGILYINNDFPIKENEVGENEVGEIEIKKEISSLSINFNKNESHSGSPYRFRIINK